jgi:hypothetical protein
MAIQRASSATLLSFTVAHEHGVARDDVGSPSCGRLSVPTSRTDMRTMSPKTVTMGCR